MVRAHKLLNLFVSNIILAGEHRRSAGNRSTLQKKTDKSTGQTLNRQSNGEEKINTEIARKCWFDGVSKTSVEELGQSVIDPAVKTKVTQKRAVGAAVC